MSTDIIVLVHSIHPPVTLLLRDDLSGVLGDDLMRLERPVAPDAISTVRRLDHLHTDVEFPTSLASPS